MNVLDFANHMDQSGQRFYQDMSSLVQHPGLKKIFSLLADDEKKLLTRLHELQENSEYSRYDSAALNSSENIFDQLIRREDQLRPKDDVAAYHLALEAEKKVIGEYEKAARSETQPEVKALLRKIINEELGELKEIESLYNFVNAPNEYLEWGEFSNLDEFHNFGRDVDQ